MSAAAQMAMPLQRTRGSDPPKMQFGLNHEGTKKEDRMQGVFSTAAPEQMTPI